MRKCIIFILAMALFPVSSFAGLWGDPPEIKMVKNGIIDPRYRSTTIGKAFNAAFDGAEWTLEENSKGQKIVRCTGTISEGFREDAMRLYYAELSRNPQVSSIVNYFVTQIGFDRWEELKKQYKDGSDYDLTRALVFEASPGFFPVGSPVFIEFLVVEDDYKAHKFGGDAISTLSWSEFLDTVYY